MRDRPPLDAEALERLAIGYVGRYATSRARLAGYLSRKLGERGWAGDRPADVAALVERLAALGYIDDAALAEARGRSLARRGYGRARVGTTLRALGIAGEDGAGALAAAKAAGWETALRFAERRRLGPFAAALPDEAGRRRAFAAMLRAGHAPEHVRLILSAPLGTVPPWDEN